MKFYIVGTKSIARSCFCFVLSKVTTLTKILVFFFDIQVKFSRNRILQPTVLPNVYFSSDKLAEKLQSKTGDS